MITAEVETDALRDEESAKLAELSIKALNPAVSGTSQNAPQNQVESKPAIEAAEAESEPKDLAQWKLSRRTRLWRFRTESSRARRLAAVGGVFISAAV